MKAVKEMVTETISVFQKKAKVLAWLWLQTTKNMLSIKKHAS